MNRRRWLREQPRQPVKPKRSTTLHAHESRGYNHSLPHRVIRPMKKLLLVSCVIGAVAIDAGAAQETPSTASQTFEVASVKPNKSGERGGGIRRLPGGRVIVTNMAPRILITFAYQLAQFQLVGGPAWLGCRGHHPLGVLVRKDDVSPDSPSSPYCWSSSHPRSSLPRSPQDVTLVPGVNDTPRNTSP
jgi:hypothetical protein